MTPEQIRKFFSYEDGFEGYERYHGRTDDILRDVPRRRPDDDPARSTSIGGGRMPAQVGKGL